MKKLGLLEKNQVEDNQLLDKENIFGQKRVKIIMKYMCGKK